MQKDHKEFGIDCGECCKKQKLIDKYLNLIDLLKKKSDKSQLSTTLKKSIDAGTQNQSPQSSSNYQRVNLPTLMHEIAHRRRMEAFGRIRQAALESRCHKGYLFVQTIQRIIYRKIIQTAKKLFLENSGGGDKQSILREQDKKGFAIDKSVSRNQSYCSLGLYLEGQKREKLKGLSRRVFELSQELALVRYQKKSSDEQINQNLRRQEVESKKKKESLEMLAEEMAQKNQVISELQATLRFYQAREGNTQNNVLEDDTLTMKRQIEKMEKLNQKLIVELEKKTEQLQKNTEELSGLREKAAKIEIQYGQLKQKNFEMGIQLRDLEKKKQQYNSLSLFLEKKLTNLKKYEKLISCNLKAIEQASLSDKSSFNSTLKPKNSCLLLEDPIVSEPNLEDKENNKEFAPITKFQNQYKIEKILNYLYNIELEDVWINNEQKLFDNEQLNVLNDVKLKFAQLNDQLRTIKTKKRPPQPSVEAAGTPSARLSKPCGQQDQVYFNEQHVSGSIFEVFASEKVQKEVEPQRSVHEFEVKQCKSCVRQDKSGEVTSRRMGQGLTIKLLELQIQKNKQVEKISELKSKLFHIRSVVMNLIKSLEVRTLKPESRDIIDVCFEFFQYSEEEKEIIFHTHKKEKKFLGLF